MKRLQKHRQQIACALVYTLLATTVLPQFSVYADSLAESHTEQSAQEQENQGTQDNNGGQSGNTDGGSQTSDGGQSGNENGTGQKGEGSDTGNTDGENPTQNSGRDGSEPSGEGSETDLETKPAGETDPETKPSGQSDPATSVTPEETNPSEQKEKETPKEETTEQGTPEEGTPKEETPKEETLEEVVTEEVTTETLTPEEVPTEEVALFAQNSLVSKNAATPSVIASWEWIDEWEVLSENADGVLGFGAPNVSAANPVKLATISEYLPTQITAVVEDEDDASIADTVTLTLGKWRCDDFPKEGSTGGTYLFEASLPKPYELTDGSTAVTLPVELGDGTTYEEELPTSSTR